MATKKELKELYKRLRPDMGLLSLTSEKTGNCFLLATQDIKSNINRARFQLNMGGHPHGELQKEWNENGEDSFRFIILEYLPYGTDESKTDYTEELSILQLIWEEKLIGRGTPFFIL